MDYLCTYYLEIRGQMDEAELNRLSPLQMTIVRVKVSSTLASVHTDQSGLVGLLRHLHGKGFVLLSISRE